MSRAGAQQEVRSFNTEDVLRDETEALWGKDKADAIWGDKAKQDTNEPPLPRYGRAMLESGQAALCLSGGGIRSAAFALGVVQALSRKNLLPCFHYLSTVSGGGYLGSFLSRWIQEEKGDVAKVQRLLAEGHDDGVEPAPIQWLRENSNFITPRIGIASADTWTAIAMSVRNILINWLVFAPALLIAVALPNLAAALLSAAEGEFAQWSLFVGTIAITIATWQGARNLPSHLRNPHRKTAEYVFWLVVAPATVGAAAMACAAALDLLAPDNSLLVRSPATLLLDNWFARVPIAGWARIFSDNFIVIAALERIFNFTVVALVGGYLLAWVNASAFPLLHRDWKLAWSNNLAFLQNVPWWTLGSVVAAFIYVAGLSVVEHVDCPTVAACGRRIDAFAALAILWGIVSQLVLTIIFVAFRAVRGNLIVSPDLDREWLARLSALKIRVGLFWTIFAAASLLYPHMVGLFEPPARLNCADLYALYPPDYQKCVERIVGEPRPIDTTPVLKAWLGPVVQWVTAIAGGLSALLAAFGGKAAATGYRAEPGTARTLFTRDVVIGIATFLGLLMLLALFGRLEFTIGEWLARNWFATIPGSWPMVVGHGAAILAIGLVLMITSARINVNRFSLNGMYRNRLTKAFLGAPRRTRPDADPFTQFAPLDNPRFHSLKAVSGTTSQRVLMPVVNVALNLVGGRRLAWQERKAQSFVFTPLHCGSAALAQEKDSRIADGRYVSSEVYAGNEPDLGPDETGVSLGTAVAISGAAASPSMGYHSSPATALLMTLLNVRLGAWLPNPARTDLAPRMRSSGPRYALLPLLRELLGRTDARRPDVYLSDGGHFENLGLYEMVRRRCRYIVVSDAGCDPDATFADLGNAIRKIRIDLGVEIKVETVKIASRETWKRNESTYFALGTIHYPEGTGDLLYIKPACHDGIPADVRAYALASKTFPHESTADQWFSESQFESYRSLGANLMDRLGKQKTDSQSKEEIPDSYADCDLAGFFKNVHEKVEATHEQVAGLADPAQGMGAPVQQAAAQRAVPGPAGPIAGGNPAGALLSHASRPVAPSKNPC